MKTIIGIIGTIAAGKDTAAEYISEKYSLPIYQISSIVKKEAKEKGIELTRENLIALGRSMAKERGDSYLAEKLFSICKEKAIIAGMRQLGQIHFFKKHTNFFLIGIEADKKIRFKRTQQRMKKGDPQTIEAFENIEKQDNTSNTQNVTECMKLANYIVENNTNTEEFYMRIDNIMGKIL